MFSAATSIRNVLLRLHGDTLFRNSFYLMLATLITAGFGFLFWLINARVFVVQDIGIATTLISVMNLIALLSLVGLDTTVVRFLSTSTEPNGKINSALILVSAAAIILSSGFILFVKMISPNLAFMQENLFYSSIFIFSCVMNALNVLTDAIFLSGRKTKYTLAVNFISSLFKIAIPFCFIGFGAIGIFVAAGLAQTVSTLLSIGILIVQFDYRPSFSISKTALQGVWKYSGVNYATSILNLLPPTFIPILIVNHVGTEAAAYYYIVMMLGNLLYTIPWSATKSFFAEGSNDTSRMHDHTVRVVRTITFLTVPAMGVLLFFGKTILDIFGKQYANGGTTFLYLVTLSVVAVSINSIFSSLFRLHNNLQAIFLSNVIYVGAIFLLLHLLIPMGLLGVGLAWLLGSGITSVANVLLYARNARR